MAEYDPTLDGLVTKAALLQQCSNAGFETILYKPVWRLDPGELFCNLMDDNILRGVLKTWGTSATGEILDFVYFQTQPMEAGIRNAPLDFSVIQSEKPSAYSKSSSGKSQAEIQRLRTKFEDRQSQRKSARNQPFEFTPPKYDEEYFNAMTKLEML